MTYMHLSCTKQVLKPYWESKQVLTQDFRLSDCDMNYWLCWHDYFLLTGLNRVEIEKFKKVMLLLTSWRVCSINKISKFVNSQANQTTSDCHMDHKVWNILYGPYCMDHGKNLYKGSPYLSHFNLDINVGKKRIRHWTTLNFNDLISIRFE